MDFRVEKKPETRDTLFTLRVTEQDIQAVAVGALNPLTAATCNKVLPGMTVSQALSALAKFARAVEDAGARSQWRVLPKEQYLVWDAEGQMKRLSALTAGAS